MTRFVHLSDLHLSPDFEAQGQPDTSINLKNAVKIIQGLEPTPEFVVVSGDLTNTGSKADFALAKELLDTLPMPVLLTLGNCDDRKEFYKTFLPEVHASDEPYNHSQIFGDVHIILMDSTIPKKLSGELRQGQLDWLSEALEQSPDIPKVVVIHHPPTPVAIPVLSSILLKNAQEFEKRLKNKNVIAILCGHVHYNQVSFLGDVPCFISSGLHTHFDITFQEGLKAMDKPSFNLCSVVDKKIVVQTLSLPSSGEVLKEIPNEVMQANIDKVELN